MKLSTEDIAKALGVSPINTNANLSLNNISIDSRDPQKDNIFIAIKGEHHNGHDFIDDAFEKGASIAITEQHHHSYPVFVVDNTIKALGKIANYYSLLINPITIGITGTNGKTTVTNLVANILKKNNKTIQTLGNYNNSIGLPLSIMRAEDDTKYFVLEMGARKIGDIRELTAIAKPNIVALLNVSSAHLDTFHTIENILKTKEEIFEDQGYKKIVILNKDDINFNRWHKKSSRHEIRTISRTKDADYKVTAVSPDKLLLKTYRGDMLSINIKNTEDYYIDNILFSVALATEAGASISDVKNGIESFEIPSGRFNKIKGINDCTIIDSTYNANPASFKASIDSLVSIPGEHLMIMGEMGELGNDSFNHHLDVISYAINKGTSKIFLKCSFSDKIKEKYDKNIIIFDNIDELKNLIYPVLNSNSVILVKASRFMRFEEITKILEFRN